MFPYHLFHFPRSHGLIMIDQSYISFQRTLPKNTSKGALSFPSEELLTEELIDLKYEVN